MARRLSKSVFKYFVKYEEIVDPNDFKSLWKMIKMLMGRTNGYVVMDFSDFALALKTFNVPKR